MSSNRLGGLADLVGEIEYRLTGSSQRRLASPGLESLDEASSLVLILFDGLGLAQLEHQDAGPFRECLAGYLDSPFPTTTSVALSSLATGLDPIHHGLTAHLMLRPDLDTVVNTLKWVDLTGARVDADYRQVLPAGNLWERLSSAGWEPITVQPGAFADSPLSQMLYRGARFEPAYTYEELVDATVSLAAQPRRLIFTYLSPVDVAGHVHGLGSSQFADAMKTATVVWDQIRNRLPAGVSLLGTADHGLVEYFRGQQGLGA